MKLDPDRPKYAYDPTIPDLRGDCATSAAMDFDKLAELKATLNDAQYVEYIFHKLFDNPSAEFTLDTHTVWGYPECWLARYYCYYVVHRQLLKDAKILELGSNLNFYSVWAALNGASSVDCIEPETTRKILGDEYVKLRNLSSVITTSNLSINEYMQQYTNESYDVVFFLDVIYYLTNGVDVLDFIKNKIKPKFLFFESSVVDDYCNNGHFEFWSASTDTKKMQSFSRAGNESVNGLMPSRNVLHSVLNQLGWEVVFYYNYQDFIGRGESPPRKSGHKSFYVLKNTDTQE
jgi:2-polyprenyl-3-methyl-5-hydroxy-6-metoxy-1,4-benzoquinol methylase